MHQSIHQSFNRNQALNHARAGDIIESILGYYNEQHVEGHPVLGHFDVDQHQQFNRAIHSGILALERLQAQVRPRSASALRREVCIAVDFYDL